MIKVENQLQTEVGSKTFLEDSLAKYRKIRQDWAIKVFQSDPSNEDLDNLLSLEPETMKAMKLNLQILQRELYEKELDGIMDVLKMPSEDRVYTNILPMIKNLLEQVDTEHYTNTVENLMS